MPDMFRQIDDAPPVRQGAGQKAVVDDPSPLSGRMAAPPVPVWKGLVDNTHFQREYAEGIRAEGRMAAGLNRTARGGSSAAPRPPSWKVGDGWLERDGQKYDAEDLLNDPEAGEFAAKSLWQRDLRGLGDDIARRRLDLRDPSRSRLTDTELFGMRMELGMPETSDERKREIEARMADGEKSEAERSELFELEKRQLELRQGGVDEWRRRRVESEGAEVAARAEKRAALIARAHEKAVEEEAGLRERISQGLPAAEMAEAQARLAEVADARGRFEKMMEVPDREVEAIRRDAEEVGLAERGKAVVAAADDMVGAFKEGGIFDVLGSGALEKRGGVWVVGDDDSLDGVFRRVQEKHALGDDDLKVAWDEASRQAREVEKDFFGLRDVASGVWDAFKGLRVTAPAAFFQLKEGFERPDQYSDRAKRAFAAMEAFTEEMNAKSERYGATKAGDAFREAASSMGFTLGSMGAAIPATIAGAKAGGVTGAAIGGAVGAPAAGVGAAPGAVVGGKIGAVVGGGAAGMAASGTAAYRMAGAMFLNETFNNYLEHVRETEGREATEAEKQDIYKKLLPLAEDSALWEAGPEAVGNAIQIRGLSFIFNFGKKKLAADAVAKSLGRNIVEKTGAALGTYASELATETITEVGQSAADARGERVIRGEDYDDIALDWSPGAIAENFQNILPATTAIMILTGGVAGGVKGVATAMDPQKEEKKEAANAIDRINMTLAAQDPGAEAVTAEEFRAAREIANDGDGAEGLATAVSVIREMNVARETARIRIEDAEAEFAAAKGTDQELMFEEALNDARVRAMSVDRASGALKIASGKARLLTKAERDALGVHDDGSLFNDEELAAVGLSRHPLVGGADGSPILTDELVRQVKARFPEAEKIIKLSESEAGEKAAARAKPAGTSATYRVTGEDGASVDVQATSEADAVARAVKSPGWPLGEQADGAILISGAPAGEAPAARQSPAATAEPTIYKSIGEARLAGEKILESMPNGEYEVTLPDGTTGIAIKSDNRGFHTKFGDKNAGFADASTLVAFENTNVRLDGKESKTTVIQPRSYKLIKESPAQAESRPDSLPDEPQWFVPGDSGAAVESSPATGQSTPKVAVKKNPRVRKALAKAKKMLGGNLVVTDDPGVRVVANDDGTIQINIEALEAEAEALGVAPDKAAAWIAMVIDEEVSHAATHHAAYKQWLDLGSPGEYAAWRAEHYGNLWDNEFTAEQRKITEDIYGSSLNGLEKWEKAFEGLRIIRQKTANGTTAEVVRMWASLSEKVVAELRLALQALKRILKAGEISPALQREIDALNKQLTEYDRKNKRLRKGDPRPDNQKPAAGQEGAGDRGKAEKSGDSGPAIDGQADAARSDEAGSPAGPRDGDTVTFRRDGVEMTGKVGRVATNGNMVVVVDGKMMKVEADEVVNRSSVPDLKGGDKEISAPQATNQDYTDRNKFPGEDYPVPANVVFIQPRGLDTEVLGSNIFTYEFNGSAEDAAKVGAKAFIELQRQFPGMSQRESIFGASGADGMKIFSLRMDEVHNKVTVTGKSGKKIEAPAAAPIDPNTTLARLVGTPLDFQSAAIEDLVEDRIAEVFPGWDGKVRGPRKGDPDTMLGVFDVGRNEIRINYDRFRYHRSQGISEADLSQAILGTIAHEMIHAAEMSVLKDIYAEVESDETLSQLGVSFDEWKHEYRKGLMESLGKSAGLRNSAASYIAKMPAGMRKDMLADASRLAPEITRMFIEQQVLGRTSEEQSMKSQAGVPSKRAWLAFMERTIGKIRSWLGTAPPADVAAIINATLTRLEEFGAPPQKKVKLEAKPAPAAKKKRAKRVAVSSRTYELFIANPFVSKIMEQGGMMSASRAKKEMGAAWWKENSSLYDDAFTFSNPTFNVIYSRSGQITPDRMAEYLAREGLMPDGDVNRMWEELRKAEKSTTSINRQISEQEQQAKDADAEAKQRAREFGVDEKGQDAADEQAVARMEAQDAAFAKANRDADGNFDVFPSDLEIGEVVTIGGEKFEVRSKDADGTVTLEDGARFGRQVVDGDISLWVEMDEAPFTSQEESAAEQIIDEVESKGYESFDEFAEAEPEAARDLDAEAAERAGIQSDESLLPDDSGAPQDGSQEGFGLETQTDEQIKAEEAAAKRKAEIEKRRDKRLTGSAGDLTADMFGEGDTPLFNEARNKPAAKPALTPDEQKKQPKPKRITYMDLNSRFRGIGMPDDVAARYNALVDRLGAKGVEWLANTIRKDAGLGYENYFPMISDLELNEKVAEIYREDWDPSPALTPDEQALKDFMNDLGEGLEAAPINDADFYRSKGIPRDKRAAFLDVADKLYDAGVRTPEALAAKLEKIGAGKLRAYSAALWSGMQSSYPDLPNVDGWAEVYGEMDNPAAPQEKPATPSMETLESMELIRQWGDKWQYKMRVGGTWYHANSKEGAMESAVQAYNATPEAERKTRKQRDTEADAAYDAKSEELFGGRSKAELEKQLSEIERDIAKLQAAGKNEFTGQGTRRTGAATSNEAARGLGETKMRLERYLREKFAAAAAESNIERIERHIKTLEYRISEPGISDLVKKENAARLAKLKEELKIAKGTPTPQAEAAPAPIILWGRHPNTTDGKWVKVTDNTSKAEIARREKEGWEVLKYPANQNPGDIEVAPAPAPIISNLNREIERAEKTYGSLNEERLDRAIIDAAWNLAGDARASERQDALEYLTGTRPPKAKAGVNIIAQELRKWVKKNPVEGVEVAPQEEAALDATNEMKTPATPQAAPTLSPYDKAFKQWRERVAKAETDAEMEAIAEEVRQSEHRSFEIEDRIAMDIDSRKRELKDQREKAAEEARVKAMSLDERIAYQEEKVREISGMITMGADTMGEATRWKESSTVLQAAKAELERLKGLKATPDTAVESAPKRYIGFSKDMRGNGYQVIAIDDVVQYTKSHPHEYGMRYFDTQENRFVKAGVRGPVQAKGQSYEIGNIKAWVEESGGLMTAEEMEARYKKSDDTFTDSDRARHKKSRDAAIALGMVAGTTPQPVPTLPEGVSQEVIDRMDREIERAESRRDKLQAINDKMNEESREIPGSFATGRSNQDQGLVKRRGAMNDRLAKSFNLLQEAETKLRDLKERREGYASGERHENGQPRANSPSRKDAASAVDEYGDYLRATVKKGDRITFTSNPAEGGSIVKSVNKKTITLEGGTSWSFDYFMPWKDGKEMTRAELSADLKAWREGKDEPQGSFPAPQGYPSHQENEARWKKEGKERDAAENTDREAQPDLSKEIADHIANKGKIPEVDAGFIRLYRGEDSEAGARSSGENTGKFWSKYYSEAETYGDRIYYLDVPSDSINTEGSSIFLAPKSVKESEARLFSPGYFDTSPEVADAIEQQRWDDAARLHKQFNALPDTAVESTADIEQFSPEQAASELNKRGLTIQKNTTKTGKTVWHIKGKTYDVKDQLKSLGAKYYPPTKAWSIFSDEDPTTKIANVLAGKSAEGAVSQGSETDSRPGRDADEDLRLRELRSRLDGQPDERGTGGDAVSSVDPDTAALIRLGMKFGMPAEVVDSQIEDVASITAAYQKGKPMFLLGNAAGTGKTFVLGGAIREMRAKGAKSFVYVTMNTDLIAQIKKDLAAYGMDDVSFHTYSEMSTKPISLPAGAVLIFDEAHNVKTEDSKRGAVAQAMMGRSKFTIFASATPFENPVEAGYLAGTGIFNEAGGHVEFAKAYGANVRKVKSYDSNNNEIIKEYVYWTAGKLEDGLAARQWFVRQGIMVTRPMRLPMDKVKAAFSKHKADQQWVTMFNEVTQAYEEAMSQFRDENGNILDPRNNSQVAMHMTNALKRILEASKVDQAVERAQGILNDGGNVVIFVETKAERWIGRYRASQLYDKKSPLYTYPEMLRMMETWMMAADFARKSGEKAPPRPFAESIMSIARAMYEAGIEHELPSVEQEIVERLGGKDKVAIYTGSVSGAAATKDKAAFLSGQKKVIVATMAKGGTGLSLHDTVGDRPTSQININLPWKASGVDQVGARVARYGLQSDAAIDWLFAENIPFERSLAYRVGRRMRDMGAIVSGIDVKAANVLADGFDFEGSVDVKQVTGEVEVAESDIFEQAERMEKGRRQRGDQSGGFFETPFTLSALMTVVSGARGRLLEPSAGKGNLIRFAKDSKAVKNITMVEKRADNADYLESSFVKDMDGARNQFSKSTVVRGDFMEESATIGSFDTIHMNPPFERVKGVGAQDVAHVMAAYDLLAPGGRLVAIMGEGAFFRSTNQEREFRQWLDDRGAIVVKLPEDAFKNSNTSVRTRMVIIDQNADAGRTDINLEDMDADSLRSVADAIPLRDNDGLEAAPIDPEARRKTLPRIRRSFNELESLAESQNQFRFWFRDFKSFLEDYLGPNKEYAPLVSEFLSATSAASTVAANVEFMMKALREYIETGTFVSDYLNAHEGNLHRAQSGQRLSGPKISEYSDAVFGIETAVPVDRHIAQLLFNTDKPTKAQIKAAKIRVSKVGLRLGWTPRETMAALWAANIERNGRTPQSYERYLQKHRYEIKRLLTADREGNQRGLKASRRIAARIEQRRSDERGVDGRDSGGLEAAPIDPAARKALAPLMGDAARRKELEEIQADFRDQGKVMGRPDLANPGMTAKTREAMELEDEIRKNTARRENRAQWEQEGRRRASKENRDHVIRQWIENGAKAEGFVGEEFDRAAAAIAPEDVYAIRYIMEDMAKEAGGNKQKLADVAMLRTAYRSARSNIARVMAAGTDWLKTPEQRHREAIFNLITEPSLRDMADIESRAWKSHSDKEAAIKEASLKRLDKFEKKFAEMGITLEQLLGGDVFLSLDATPVMKRVMSALKDAESMAVKMMQQGAGLDSIRRRTGMNDAQIEQVRAKMEADLRAELYEKVKAGLRLEDIRNGKGLQAAPLEDPTPLTEEEIQAEMERIIRIGFGIPAKIPKKSGLPAKAPKTPKKRGRKDDEAKPAFAADATARRWIDRLQDKEGDTGKKPRVTSEINKIIKAHVVNEVPGFIDKVKELGVSDEHARILDEEAAIERERRANIAAEKAKNPKKRAPRIDTKKPHEVDWQRPEFTEALESYTFDTTDRTDIIRRVVELRNLVGAAGKVSSLTGEKLTKATRLMAEVAQILAKHNLKIKDLAEGGMTAESYRFDISDRRHVAIIARTIMAMDATALDKVGEYYYASLLSGLQTMAVNTTSIFNTTWNATVERAFEALANLFFRNPDNATFAEFKYVERAMRPMLARAWSNATATWSTEMPIFEEDILNRPPDLVRLVQGISGYKPGAIGGKKGRLIRTPTRILMATDNFLNTARAVAEVGAQAYRMSQVLGLKEGSPEFDSFMKEQVNTPGSIAWQRAADKALAGSFMEPMPGQKKTVQNASGKRPNVEVRTSMDVVGAGVNWVSKGLTPKDADTTVHKFFKAIGKMFFFPFVRVPYNITKQGVERTINPISILDILLLYGQSITYHEGRLRLGRNAELNQRIIENSAKLLQGVVIMAILAAMSEGDDDDLEKKILITGSKPFRETKAGERQLAYRLGAGPYTVSIRLADGRRASFYYGRIEPVATILGGTVDTLRAGKGRMRGAKTTPEAINDMAMAWMSQVNEKTSMRGAADLMAIINQERPLDRFAADRVAMVMPNLVRQAVRESDPYFRQPNEDFASMVQYGVWPRGQTPPRVGLYGEAERRPGRNAIKRMLDLTKSAIHGEPNDVDVMIHNWITQHGNDVQGIKIPQVSRTTTYVHPVTGERTQMTPGQKASYDRIAGRFIEIALKGTPLNIDNPTEEDMEQMNRMVDRARSYARNQIFSNPKWHQLEKTTLAPIE